MKDISKDSKISDNNLKDVNGGFGEVVIPDPAFSYGTIVYMKGRGNEKFYIAATTPLPKDNLIYYELRSVNDSRIVFEGVPETDISHTPF